MGTRKGVIKKTDLSRCSAIRAPSGIIAMGVEEGDSVIAVELSDGHEQIFLGTRDGMAIRFEETDVRPMGRTAYGVRGITPARGRRGRRDGRRPRRAATMTDRDAERLRQAHRARVSTGSSRAAASARSISRPAIATEGRRHRATCMEMTSSC